MAVSIKKLEAQLMERIDATDLMQVEKVERYISFVETIRRIDKVVKEEGESVVTENGAQRFVKPHPLLAEKTKANASLLSIEKSFGFIREEPEKRSSNDLI